MGQGAKVRRNELAVEQKEQGAKGQPVNWLGSEKAWYQRITSYRKQTGLRQLQFGSYFVDEEW